MKQLKRVGILLSALTFGLIVWGGHVNSTNSGMAFPDWPTSNASAMITYTPSQWLWQGDRFWEHGHRLFATLVGIVTTVLLVLAYRSTPRESRPNGIIISYACLVFVVIVSALFGFNPMIGGFMEAFMIALTGGFIYFLFRSVKTNGHIRILWLSLAAFTAVCLQGAFGGYTVRNSLPWWTSTIHGILAEVFFMTVIGITFLAWRSTAVTKASGDVPSAKLKAIVFATWGFTFIQFILGALTRHTHAWGASLSWPQWSDEGFFPGDDMFRYPQVLVHFAHRTFAYIVALMTVTQWILIRNLSRKNDGIAATTRYISGIGALGVVLQIGLGVLVLTTFRNEVVTTLHVMTGVALLAINTILMYRIAAGKSASSMETVYGARPVISGKGQR